LIGKILNKLLGNSKHIADKDFDKDSVDNELVSEPLNFATKLKDYFQNTIDEIAQLFSSSCDSTKYCPPH